MRPMLATVADRVPTGDAWVHEVKWDGMRVLVDVRDGVVTVWSRNERDVTAAYPELEDLGRDYDDMLLDGEVVALDGGRPSFHALTERMHVADRRRAQRLAATRPVTLMVFDLLRLFGSDLTAQPWSARRALLERLALTGRALAGAGGLRRRAAAARGDQGAGPRGHREQAPHRPLRRGPPFARLAQDGAPRQPVGRGGWLATGGRVATGGSVPCSSACPTASGGWRYAGRVGSGLAGTAGEALALRLRPLHRDTSPFADEVPAIDANGTTWVEPRVVIEVRTLELTGQHRLRQPAYLGVRSDLNPADLEEVDDA